MQCASGLHCTWRSVPENWPSNIHEEYNISFEGKAIAKARIRTPIGAVATARFGMAVC